MPKRVKVDGKVFVVPDDATPDEIDQISRGSSAPPTAATPPEKPGLLSRAWDSAGNLINNFEDATIGTHTNEGVIKGFTEGIPHMVMHPIDSAKLIGGAVIGSHLDTANDAVGQMKKPGFGNKLEGGFRYLQSGIPLIGPQLDRAGQQMKEGDVSGGLGTTLGVASMIGSPKMSELGAKGLDVGGRAVRNYLDQKIVPGTPEQLITRATKPTVGLPEYEQSVKTAMPELAGHKPNSLNSLAEAADKLKTAKNQEFTAMKQKAGNQPVIAYPSARAQVDSIPATDRFENPNIVQKTASIASPYQTTMPIDRADAIRVDTNAKLRDFYNKSGGDQHAALSNPHTARIKAVNDSIRNAEYDAISQGAGIAGPEIEANQTMYGHAVDIGDTAARRNTVFSRQQPVPLVSQIAAAHASPAGFAISKYISGLNDSDALVNRAFDRYNRNLPIPSTTPNPMRRFFIAPGKLGEDQQ